MCSESCRLIDRTSKIYNQNQVVMIFSPTCAGAPTSQGDCASDAPHPATSSPAPVPSQLCNGSGPTLPPMGAVAVLLLLQRLRSQILRVLQPGRGSWVDGHDLTCTPPWPTSSGTMEASCKKCMQILSLGLREEAHIWHNISVWS